MSESIRKSELAALLQISRARVSQLVSAGLPVLADGRLDREKALLWVAQYCSGHGGGQHFRRPGPDISERATELLRPAPVNGLPHPPVFVHRRSAATPAAAPSARQVLDRILANRAVIGELLLHLGVRDVAAIAAAVDAFATAIVELGGEDFRAVYGWPGNDDIPAVQIDLSAFAAQHGLAYNPEAESTADELCDRVSEFFTRAVVQ